jgi:hypothetical protein
MVFTGDHVKVSGGKSDSGLPVTVMAVNQATFTVLPRDAKIPSVSSLRDPSVRERWNDYGIGLLLQGDIRAPKPPS